MNRAPLALRRIPPSPRTASVTSRPRTPGGQAMPVALTPEVLAFRQDCLVEFVADLVGHCQAQGAATTVCLLPLVGGVHGLPDWSRVAALPGLGTLATDPYWKAFGEPAGHVGEAAHLLVLRHQRKQRVEHDEHQ